MDPEERTCKRYWLTGTCDDVEHNVTPCEAHILLNPAHWNTIGILTYGQYLAHVGVALRKVGAANLKPSGGKTSYWSSMRT